MDSLETFSSTAYVSLRTYRKSGASVDTPVWGAVSGDTLYVFSAGQAGKVKRLRNNSQAQLAVCDVRGKLLGEWCDATASIVTDESTIQNALKALRKKYGWQMWMADVGSKLTGKFDKRAYLQIEMKGEMKGH